MCWIHGVDRVFAWLFLSQSGVDPDHIDEEISDDDETVATAVTLAAAADDIPEPAPGRTAGRAPGLTPSSPTVAATGAEPAPRAPSPVYEVSYGEVPVNSWEFRPRQRGPMAGAGEAESGSGSEDGDSPSPRARSGFSYARFSARFSAVFLRLLCRLG